MGDVYISYCHDDYAAAERVAEALWRAGFTAFLLPPPLEGEMDAVLRDLETSRAEPEPELPPGVAASPMREEDSRTYQIASASAVVVLWSARSVGSELVRREALLAADHGKFVPVLTEPVTPPILTQYPTADLSTLVDAVRLRIERAHEERLSEAVKRERSDGERRRIEAAEEEAVRARRAEERSGRERIEAERRAREAMERARMERDTGAMSRPAPSVASGSGPSIYDRTKVAVNAPRQLGSDWEVLRAYLYPAFRESDVEQDAQRLRPAVEARHTSDSTCVSKIRNGTPITVTIHHPAADCRPARRQFVWKGRWHKTDFIVRYRESSAQNHPLTISWFAEMVCIGQVQVTVPFADGSRKDAAATSFHAAPGYEAVFVSYSTKDSAIVDWLETTYTALGMTYLRDVRTLRSGEEWSERLLQLIRGADLFQLCWSANAKQSDEVAKEWRCALGVEKHNFIRPCYWERPMPQPPPELRKLHFTALRLNWFTRMWLRLHAWFG